MGNECRKASAHDMYTSSKEGAANGSDTLSASSRRSRSKRKGPNSNNNGRDENLVKKRNPALTGKSADSFGREGDEEEKQRKRMHGVGMFTGEDWDQPEPVMITDYLSNVRDRYHVSHKE